MRGAAAEIKYDVVGGGIWPMATSDGRFAVLSVIDEAERGNRSRREAIVGLYKLKDGNAEYRGRVPPADCRVAKVRLAEGIRKIAAYAAYRPPDGGFPKPGLYIVDLPE